MLWVESMREPQAEKTPGELPLEFGYRSPNNSGYDNEAKKKEVKAVSLDGECRRREVRVNTEEAMFMGG